MQYERYIDTLHNHSLFRRFGYPGVIVLGVVLVLVGIFVRSDILLSVVNVILEVLGWVVVVIGAATVGGGAYLWGKQRGWWASASSRPDGTGTAEDGARTVALVSPLRGRQPLVSRGLRSIFFLFIVVFFFLPWMSVSCFGFEELTLTGFDMMLLDRVRVADYELVLVSPLERVPVYIAAALVVAGIGAVLLNGRVGTLVRAGVALGGVLILIIMLVVTPIIVGNKIEGGLEENGVGIHWQVGFYLSLIAYIVAAIVQFVPFPFSDRGSGSDDDT